MRILLLLLVVALAGCTSNDPSGTNDEDCLDESCTVPDCTADCDDGQMEPVDSDGDGITDEVENAEGTDPNKPDSDGDGLNDKEEKDAGTDPNNPDSDGDGFSDGKEVEDGTDPNDANDPPPRAPVTWDISISGNDFVSGSITIQVGDTVRWTHNDGTVPHTVTADDDSFDSGACPGPACMTSAANNEFTHTFNAAGTFPYHCEVHSGMTDTITVLARYDGTPA